MKKQLFFAFLAGFVTCLFISWRKVSVPQVVLSADKMNIFYLGVDNPISVTSSQGSIDSGAITTDNGKIVYYNGKTVINTDHEGECNVKVSVNNYEQNFPFRSKRIPDPVPVLGAGPERKGGKMIAGMFKAQLGVAAILENFDFEARCSVISYDIVRVTKDSSPAIANNIGSRFTNEAKELIMLSKWGDIYYFNSIQARCPGDVTNRYLGSMAFEIR